MIHEFYGHFSCLLFLLVIWVLEVNGQYVKSHTELSEQLNLEKLLDLPMLDCPYV
jgi:hypothetical protein